MQLQNLASGLAGQLGASFHVRAPYHFVAPAAEGIVEQSIDAAIFSSPVASLHTAAVGFADLADVSPETLTRYAYLGAPLLIAGTEGRLSAFRFAGTPAAEQIGSLEAGATAAPAWVRDTVRREISSAQLSLTLGTGRELLVQGAQGALSQRVQALMDVVVDERGLGRAEAFQIAMAVIRGVRFDQWKGSRIKGQTLQYVRGLGARFGRDLSFANIPPEAIAELYERFAVEDRSRKRDGVVYTPAWLARFVVSRLPPDAFISGTAVDPTCGSGTFLVCYLERLVEERAKRDLATAPEQLRHAVTGLDIDPVAIEAARLSLDFFAASARFASPDWQLHVADSTSDDIDGDWIIGNLPFGYRTHEGKKDISSVILEHLFADYKRRAGLALILPDSLAYTKSAAKARGLLRTLVRIDEITRLPETAFVESAVQTLVLSARWGKPSRETVVREVKPQDIAAFRSGSYVSRTYVSRFPEDSEDVWRFSPFSNVLERTARIELRLGAVADIRVGLQVYGTEGLVGTRRRVNTPRPLLSDPRLFASWDSRAYSRLPNLNAERSQVRRQGPWDLFERPKVIVRSTTFIGSLQRLAALPDSAGVWFTDKFTGIWPGASALSINSVAAYLQTDFVQIWFATNNPSRKLRIRTLAQLPLPLLPDDWWQRAAALAPSDRVVRPAGSVPELVLKLGGASRTEWEWFNLAVNTALGIDPSSGAAMREWLQSQLSVPDSQ